MENNAHKFELNGTFVLIPKKPDLKYLYIEITNRCNLRCEMCFKQYWEDPEGDMDWELFLKILDDAEELPDLEMIYFGGIGEPTVHPRFMDMVREVKRRGFALGISTNGFLLTDKRIRELVELGVDLMYFSVDSVPTQPVDIGHIKPDYTGSRIRKIQEVKKELGKDVPHIGVEVVVTKENYNELVDVAHYVGSLGADTLLISNLLPITKEHAEMIVYDGSIDMTPIVNKLQSIYHGYLHRIAEFSLRTERHCEFIEKKVAVIRWDGEVAPCYRFLHTYPEIVFGREKKVYAYSFGNVREKSLAEIWTSRDYSWFRFTVQNALYPSCTDCPLNES
ncbi:tungsten cofactor oxidoreductase radical SAM maturase, partial [Thermococcus sp.]